MTFQALKQTNQKLFQNPKLSEHNKEVLNDYFRYKKANVGKTHLQDISSRFNRLAEKIDFPLDDPEKRDIENLIGAINHDEIKSGADTEAVIRRIISRHRNKGLRFKDLGENLVNELKELKEEEKYVKMEQSYDKLLEEAELDKEVENLLREYQEELIGIAKQLPSSKDVAIFVTFGKGCGAFPGKIPFPEQKKERYNNFRNDMKALYPDDIDLSEITPISFSDNIEDKYLSEKQKQILQFLDEVIEDNIDEFNNVMITASAGNSIYTDFPTTEDRLAEENM